MLKKFIYTLRLSRKDAWVVMTILGMMGPLHAFLRITDTHLATEHLLIGILVEILATVGFVVCLWALLTKDGQSVLEANEQRFQLIKSGVPPISFERFRNVTFASFALSLALVILTASIGPFLLGSDFAKAVVDVAFGSHGWLVFLVLMACFWPFVNTHLKDP